MRTNFAIYLYGENRKPILADFDRIAQDLSKIKRLYFEMDGSFIWTGEFTRFGEEADESIDEQKSTKWQLDGMIYDAAGAVQYVDLKGWCPLGEWVELLNVLADPNDWDRNWTVVRLPHLGIQSLAEFNHEIWKHD